MSRFGRITGIVVRALVLGTLLCIALVKLLSFASGARIFRYEGY